MHHVVRQREAGDPSFAEWVVDSAIAELPELTWHRTKAEAREGILESCAKFDRLEIVTYQDGKVIGSCILVEEDDQHIGPCIGIAWNYVLPEHRGKVGRDYLRFAYRLTERNELPAVAYTRRTGEGSYQVNYRRVKRG